jgi:hypothetical protein
MGSHPGVRDSPGTQGACLLRYMTQGRSAKRRGPLSPPLATLFLTGQMWAHLA